MASEHHVSVDTQNLATNLRMELATLHPLSNMSCIYRVPPRLRQKNEKAYTPLVISIGPFHHGREELKAMEDYKKRDLQDFLERSETSLEEFIGVLKEKEARLRDCYAKTIEFSSDDLVKMILVDAAFIIEFLLRYNFPEIVKKTDRVHTNSCLYFDILDDIWKLENQLPFFILEDLFMLANISISDLDINRKRPSLFKLIHELILHRYKVMFGIEENFKESSYHNVKHLLDFLRICILPSNLQMLSRPKLVPILGVTELHDQVEVKIKFGSRRNLFDIRFSNGKLEIPRIIAHPSTEYFLKNLVAFEQCSNGDMIINEYVDIMSCLVKTPMDVELLVQSGVIENCLKNNEGVSTFFCDLAASTMGYYRGSFYASFVEDLNRYCECHSHKGKATLKQYIESKTSRININYLCAAVIVLLILLTFIKIVCSDSHSFMNWSFKKQ